MLRAPRISEVVENSLQRGLAVMDGPIFFALSRALQPCPRTRLCQYTFSKLPSERLHEQLGFGLK